MEFFSALKLNCVRRLNETFIHFSDAIDWALFSVRCAVRIMHVSLKGDTFE